MRNFKLQEKKTDILKKLKERSRVGNLTFTLYLTPDIPPSPVGPFHISTNIPSFTLFVLATWFPSVAVFPAVSAVYVVHLFLDWNWDVYVGLLAVAASGCETSPYVCLRVEGEDTLVVAAHQEDGRQVLGQHLKPGHVQGAGHCTLSGQWQTHDDEVGCA